MFVIWVAEGTCSWKSTDPIVAAAQQRSVWPNFTGVIVPNVSSLERELKLLDYLLGWEL